MMKDNDIAKYENDRLLCNVIEFALYRFFCKCFGFKQCKVSSLNAFVSFCNRCGYELLK